MVDYRRAGNNKMDRPILEIFVQTQTKIKHQLSATSTFKQQKIKKVKYLTEQS